MKRVTRKSLRILVFGCLLVLCLILTHTRFFRSVSANLKLTAKRGPTAPKHASIRVQASDRNRHFISLSDGFELNSSYQKSSTVSPGLPDLGYEPTVLAAADFDEDGTPDLIEGYAGSSGGLITLRRGNVDSRFPNSPEAQQRQAAGQFIDSPYFPDARSFQSPVAPDFIGAGDFNADGHYDLVTASRSDRALYFFVGDGHGNLSEPTRIELSGKVTAMTIGEVNREDGLADILVGVATNDGPKALIFQSPQGALHDPPTAVPLPAEATSLASGHLRGRYEMDLAVGAGPNLVIVPGRDPFINQQPVAPVQIQSIPFSIRAIALGNFTGDQKSAPDIALLGDDGQIHLADITTTSKPADKTQSRVASSSQFQIKETMAQTSYGASQLVTARVSDSATDDLIVIDSSSPQLEVVSQAQSVASAKTQSRAASSSPSFITTTLESDTAPKAVLAARLNSDALSDLVVASQGKIEPSIVFTAAAHTFTVNSNGNEPDADPSDDICSDCQRDGNNNCMRDGNNKIILNNVCSFRAAITQGNASTGADLINFNLSGSKTISPPTVVITDAVTIDGTSQGMVELNGSSAGGTGLFFSNASNCTVMGLVMNRYAGHAIQFFGGSNELVQGNYFGLNAAGTAVLAIGGDAVDTSAPNTTVGGTSAAARNVITGYLGDGIHFEDGTDNGLIQGNYIGTDPTGMLSFPGANNAAVVAVRLLGSNSTIGGTDPGARNIVAGNANGGLQIQHSGVGNGNDRIQGNYIGVNAAGSGALPNGANGNFPNGILIDAPNNLIGGATPSARNIISATTGANGVGLKFGNATGINNVVQGNFIGTDASGMNAIPNNDAGIQFFGGAGGTTIGGLTPGTGNVIAGNIGPGITTAGSVTGNVIQGNLIGTASDGSKSLGNGKAGINIQGSSSMTIGGVASGAANIIANNGAQGVRMDSGINNNIQRNSIFNNGALGIDLAPLGVTLNDPDDSDDGANHLQNFPILGSPVIGADGKTRFAVSLTSLPSTAYRIDFYSNTAGDPSNHGQGQTFLFDQTVTTDDHGKAAFVFVSSGPLAQNAVISATATDPNGNTSEFSCLDGQCCPDISTARSTSAAAASNLSPQLSCIQPYVVNVTTDDDDALPGDHDCVTNLNDPTKPCSLRAAITESVNDGGNLIIFAIPSSDPNCDAATHVCTIIPTKALPELTKPITIDATTQPGFSTVPLIQLKGSGAGSGVNGLKVSGSSSTVSGLTINGFSASGILVQDTDNVTIESCFIGTNAAGLAAAPNASDGITIQNSHACTIGGSDAASRNVIGGNGSIGINVSYGANQIGATSGDGNTIQGNYVGTGKDGTTRISNQVGGITIGTSRNMIGGPTSTRGAGLGNVIGGPHETGACLGLIGNPNFTIGANVVQGNLIGTDSTGTAAFASGNGVDIASSSNNQIGGATSDQRNVISGSIGSGVLIIGTGSDSSGNLIQGNYIGTDITGNNALPTGDASFPNQSQGIELISASNNTIGGTSAGAGNLVAGNSTAQILLKAQTDQGGNPLASKKNLVAGNRIGLLANGSASQVNGSGVVISDGQSNTIGGVQVEARNIISGNKIGLLIFDGDLALGLGDNTVAGNYIGTNITASDAVPNTLGGVVISKSSANTIGGVTPAARNVISGNVGAGGVTLIDAQPSAGQAARELSLRSYLAINDRMKPAAVLLAISQEMKTAGPVASAFLQTTTAPNSQTIDNQVLGNYIGTNSLGGLSVANAPYGVGIFSGAANNTVGRSGGGNVISGNNDTGVFIGNLTAGPAAPSGNQVSANLIGIDAQSNGNLPNKKFGILVLGASNNLIGGENQGDGNLIGFNLQDGIRISDTASTGNKIEGNFVGVDQNDHALPNGVNGIVIDQGVEGTLIGASVPLQSQKSNHVTSLNRDHLAALPAGANVISRNEGNGIEVDRAPGTLIMNSVVSNNGGLGIKIIDDGSVLPAADSSLVNIESSVVQSNQNDGVLITDQLDLSPTSFNLKNSDKTTSSPQTRVVVDLCQISNNQKTGLEAVRSGTVAGTADTPVAITRSELSSNSTQGVLIMNIANVVIGLPGFGNTIDQNGGNGIDLEGDQAARISVLGNFIGTDNSYLFQGGNQGKGVFLTAGAHDNLIGSPAGRNQIAYNHGPGIALDQSAGKSNRINSNSIHDNGGSNTPAVKLISPMAGSGLGIDIGNTGVPLPNDPGDADSGPNNLQNYPEFTSCSLDATGNLIILYKVDSAPANSNYGDAGLLVEFFKTDSGLEGQALIGSTYYTAADYAAGSPGIARFIIHSATYFGIHAGDRIVATATDADGNSSEFTSSGVGQTATQTTTSNLQFSNASFSIAEGAGFAAINISRTGDTSGAAVVRFAASDGSGREGRDYTAAYGTVNFAPGESSKSFPVLVIDNAYVTGARTVNLALTSPVGATLAAQNTATLTINDNDTTAGQNPLDQTRFFVQQHYYDFLSRYPDQSGWDFWSNNIDNCSPKPSCTDLQRINTSAAYFLSIEFQQTGFLVERFYKAAYGDAKGNSTQGGAHQLSVPIVRLAEFLPDTQEIGQGVIVGQTGWEVALENNKQAFALDFVERSRFAAALPTSLTPGQFVDQLFNNVGVTSSTSDRSAVVTEFGSAVDTSDVAARSRALRDVAENPTLINQEFNRAFVLMQYFGYLRRNPNDLPDSDYTGYDFWLTKLNQFNGSYLDAEMVKAFITSIEYRNRFAP